MYDPQLSYIYMRKDLLLQIVDEAAAQHGTPSISPISLQSKRKHGFNFVEPLWYGSSWPQSQSHQQIGVQLIQIIGFATLLFAIICYYCSYLFAKSFTIICNYCTKQQNINYCYYWKTIIAINLFSYQLLALLVLNTIIIINCNYCIL